MRWPTDAGLAADGVTALSREGRKLAARIGQKRTAVRDRTRSMGRKLRALTRTIRKRTGEAKREVLTLTEQAGQLLERSINEARKLAPTARSRARGRGAQAKLKAAKRLEELADLCEKVSSQIRQRVNGEPIKARLISLWDPDARPIRKGKLGKPTEFGYVDQLCEITANTQRGARGFILPPTSRDRQPGREHAAPRHRRRDQEPRHHTQGDRARRRVHANPEQHHAREPGRQRAHHRPPREPAPGAPAAADSATAPAPKAGSATSNAATAWTDHASKATPATRSGPAGRPSPTTPTPTPPSDDTRERGNARNGTRTETATETPNRTPSRAPPAARSTPTSPPNGFIRGK